MVSDPLLVALALALVVVNAFFVAAEIAMVRVRATRVATLAIRFTERVALWVALPMRLFQLLFAPALWLLHRASKGTLALLGITAETSGDLAHSEEELRILLAESHRVGVLSGAKRELLENVIDYTERTARHVMVPRADIAYLSLARSLEEN